MRKVLSATVLSSVLAGLLPAAAASGTEPYRTVSWKSETLADNQMTVSAVDSAGTLDVDVAKSEFAAAAVGATAADASTAQRINHAYPVTGLFGKAKDDTAVNLHTDNVSIEAAVKGNSANKEVWAPNYEFSGHVIGDVYNPIAIAGSNGGYQRFSFDLALTEAVAEAWFRVRNSEASSNKMLFKTTRSGFSFIEGETTAYSAPLQSDKWYHIEIVLRNGTADSATDHEGWLYIDGRKMAQTSFTWANSSGAAQQIKKLNMYRIGFTGSGSANAQVFAERNIYFDNVLFEYWNSAPSEAPLRTADAELSTTLAEIEEREQNGVYAGIDPSITVAQYKAALKDQTLKVSVRDKNGNEVADTDSLAGDGNFIELTAADGVKYYKNAYTTRTIYENTFDTETLAVGGAPAGGLWGINQFNDANYPAFTTAIESGIGGKRAEDKVYAENITNYAGSAEQSSKFFQLAPTFPAAVRTGDKIAAELSVLYKDTNINRNIRFEVLNSAGNKDYISFRTFAGQSTARLYYDPAGDKGDTNAKTTDITLNQWHKYALVFEQGSAHVDAYIDGIKVDIGDTELLSDGFAGISNIRYIHGVNAAAEDSPMSSNSYFDDFRVYSMPGSYAPDTAVLTSDTYAINQADGTITIEQPVARAEFDSHIQNDGYYVVYDSADKTSVQMSQLIVREGSAVFAKNAEGLTKEYIVIVKGVTCGPISIERGTGSASASVTVTNDKTEPLSASLILCSFAGERMDKVNVADFTVNAGESKDISVDLSEISVGVNVGLKAFVWDKSDFKPLCEKELIAPTMQNVPPGQEIVSDVRLKTAAEPHPRIWVEGEAGFDSLKAQITADAEAAGWHAKILASADNILDRDLCSYEDNDWRRILSSGDVRDGLITLSYAYRTTGNEAYLTRAVQEIENVIAWPEWNVYVEALDTSAICIGLSAAYDWLYDRLSDELKQNIRTAIYEKAFSILLNKYPTNGIGWMAGDNNWTFVCNGGFAIAALTLCDEPDVEEYCSDILEYSLSRLEKGINRLGEDGAWYEGVGYWDYAMRYFAMHMSALSTAAGSTYGYMELTGIKQTGLFPINMTGYKNQFNYNDSSAAPCNAQSLFFFAGQYKNATMYDFRRKQLVNGWAAPTVFDILWMGNRDTYRSMELQDALYERDNQLAVFKSGGEALTFEQRDEGERLQSAAVLHGGVNAVNHGHIDAGSFMYEAQGIRWAIDMGADNYNLYNCTDSSDSGKSRWSYYKMRGEAHNTMVVNPDGYADQNLTALAEFTRYVSKADYGYAVLDMSGVLEVPRAERAIRLDKLTGGLLVQDEFTLSEESEVYWFLNTDSTIESISEDKKTVVLSRNGKRLCIRLLTEDQEFGVMDPAQLLPTSPNPDLWEENINPDNPANPGKQQVYGRKIYIRLEKALGEKRLAVYLSPIEDKTSIYPEEEFPAVIPISEWK